MVIFLSDRQGGYKRTKWFTIRPTADYNLTYQEVKIIDPAFALTEKEYENFETK